MSDKRANLTSVIGCIRISWLRSKFGNLLFIVFAILLLSFPNIIPFTQAAAPSWIQVVDSAGSVGWYSSIALDSLGNPHIAYSDLANGHLKYASWSGSDWSIQIVDPSGDVGRFPSLAFDLNDNPHISYYDNAQGDLKYAHWTGASWDIQVIDSVGNVGGYSSLKVDSNSRPHVSYQEITNLDLKYASWTGSNWQIQTVDSSGDTGFFNSLALDPNGNPKISYSAMGSSTLNSSLKFASWTGLNWVIQTIDSTGDVGRFDSLALDKSGNAHISYYDGLNGYLKFASQQGETWNIQVVDNEGDTGDVGWSTSTALDTQNSPHIAYADERNSDIKYAWYNGTAWNIQVINSEGDFCRSPSLALSPDGYPRISYYDALYMHLKYAAVNSEGFPTPLMPSTPTASPTPSPQKNGIQIVESSGADVGRYSSLALDSNNNPHIAYFNFYRLENTSIKYASWTGSDWNIQTVEGNGYVGPFPSLAIDSHNNPNIIYRNGAMLKYALWIGSSWSFQQVGSPGEYGSANSLVLDSNDNLRLSYQETTHSQLKYASLTSQGWTLETVDANGTSVGNYNSLALDTQGNPYIAYMASLPAVGLKYANYNDSAWRTETVDAGGSGTGFTPSIAVDSTGRIHIAYFSFISGTSNCYLKYAVSSGSGWTITNVDSGNGTGQGTSLALDSHGNPHISYYDSGNNQLRYAYWNGSAWNIRIIDSVGSVGQCSSLAMDRNDQAHISYYDSTKKDLKYVHIVDPNIFPPKQSTTISPSPTPRSTSSPQPSSTPFPSSSGPVLGLIRIMSDGTVQGTNKIQRNGNTYTLTDDIICGLNDTFGPLKPCIIVMRDNAVIDGAGHTIQSNGTGLGIFMRGVQGVTIKNLNLKGFVGGISSYIMNPAAPLETLQKKTTSCQIINNDIDVLNSQTFWYSELSGYGIYVEFADNTIISGNIIKTQDSSRGIYIGNCGSTTITDNKLIGCGLNICTLNQRTISGNTIDGKPIVFLDRKSNQTIDRAEQILLYGCSQITVKNIYPFASYSSTIQLEETTGSTVTDCSGNIALKNSHNNSIYQNTPHTIVLSGSNGNKIYSNKISGSGQCIIISASSHNDIYQNNLLDSKTSPEAATLNYQGKNPDGIQFAYSDTGDSQYNNIYQNNIINHGVGIECYRFSKNNIHQNIIENCNNAISLQASDNNIFENKIANCKFAISICGSNNAVYHNNFINNTAPVSVSDQTLFTSDIITAYSTNNTFDQGYPSGGNYWSSFQGIDTNGDGISETPYKIDNKNIDHYPFMQPLNLNISTSSLPSDDPASSRSLPLIGSSLSQEQAPTSTSTTTTNTPEPTISTISLILLLPILITIILVTIKKRFFADDA
jgi:parallel beta-helix repeat protein